MALRILTNHSEDANTVRMLMLPATPAVRAVQLLPDATILSDMIAGRAEVRTILDVPQWALIMAGTAPVNYANGDPVMAQLLVYDMTIRYVCSELVPLMRQLVPNSEKSDVTNVTLELNWTQMQATFEQKAGEDLGYLLGNAFPIALAMQMARPIPTPIDPDAPYSPGSWQFGTSIPQSLVLTG